MRLCSASAVVSEAKSGLCSVVMIHGGSFTTVQSQKKETIAKQRTAQGKLVKGPGVARNFCTGDDGGNLSTG